MLPLQSLFQDFFLQEKYIRARQNTLPSAEHLLSAQQCMQQHTHKPTAAFLTTAALLWHQSQTLSGSHCEISLGASVNYHARDP